jgi:hypothetical protein
MPIVTQTLLNLIREQIHEYGTVVWYDPDRAYLEVARNLDPEAVGAEHVFSYDARRGFVALRHDLEPVWAEPTHPPKLLIYVPLAQAETEQALVEFEVGGVVMRPQQQPQVQNTALAMVARMALADVLPTAQREEVVAQAAAGKLSLSELDALADKGAVGAAGALSVVFGTDAPQEIVLRFLAGADRDSEIRDRDLADDLSDLVSSLLGVAFGAQHELDGLRAQVARQVLVIDFLEALAAEPPKMLISYPVVENPVVRQAAVDLATAWRDRTDLVPDYLTRAEQIQSEFGLGSTDFTVTALAEVETFPVTERLLQEAVERALQAAPTKDQATADVVDLARRRRAGFWSRHVPLIKIRWELIVSSGEVLLETARIEAALKGRTWTAETLVQRYSQEDAPWCALDTAQRHMERDFHLFDFQPKQHNSLLKLVAKARQRYQSVANDLAKAFLEAYAAAGFELPRIASQLDVYRDAVEPLRIEHQRVAYILVDALRFEMARELSEILIAESVGRSTTADRKPAWKTDLTAALAVPPTITRVGMAALLPEAERGMTLGVDNGDLVPRLATAPAQRLRNRQDRLAYFRQTVGGDVVTTTLNALAPLADRGLSDRLSQADIVLVTATEDIDTLCENDPLGARRLLDEVFNQLRRGLKTLFAHGIQTAVVTADHGYLFGRELTSGEKVDAPGGNTVVLKRRVWVGRGGAQSPSYMRCNLADFGISSDLELATPWTIAAFTAHGGLAYFHGGLSLPEVVIPVLTVRSSGTHQPPGAKVNWQLKLGSASGQITTRFVSVVIDGASTQLLPLEPPLVRLEVRAAGQVISTPVSATYGFNEMTKDVQLEADTANEQELQANTVMLLITEELDVQQVDILMLDATTGGTLATIENVPFSLSL